MPRHLPEVLKGGNSLPGNHAVYKALRNAFPQETTSFVGCIMRRRHNGMEFEVWKVDDLFVRILGDVQFFAGGLMAVYVDAPSLVELIAAIYSMHGAHAMAQTEKTLRRDLPGFTTDRFEWISETDWECAVLHDNKPLADLRFYAFPALYVVRPAGGQRPRELKNRMAVLRSLRALVPGRLPKI